MPVCPDADTRSTVYAGDVDSGVPNRSLAGTCTINDHVLDTEAWTNHGQFVEHVAKVGKQLVAAEVVSQPERADIVAAAANSDVGH